MRAILCVHGIEPKYKCRDCRCAAQRAHRLANRVEINTKLSAWHRANPDRKRGYRLRELYGIDLATFTRMSAQQGGRCAICQQHPVGRGPFGRLHVDHDHSTGRVRKLLCGHCNVLLGYSRERPGILQRAIQYLADHTGD